MKDKVEKRLEEVLEVADMEVSAEQEFAPCLELTSCRITARMSSLFLYRRGGEECF